jgi:CheY-like chemotaxis protein
LVVDDVPEMREVCVAMLELDGWQAEAVASVDEALTRAGERAFEVVVCDVQMPRRDGFALLRALGAERPVMLMSSFGGAGLRAEAARSGAAGYLDKPFSVRAPCDAVAAARPASH